jgi:antitoxin MazE
MSAKIQKWGNSLGIRIPKTIIEKMNLSENAEVKVEHKDGVIIIFQAKKKFSLETLVDEITTDNLHEEEIFVKEGTEVW